MDDTKQSRPRHALEKPDHIEGRLFSAQPLAPEDVRRVEDKFSQLLCVNIKLIPAIDKRLIAGVRVEVGGLVWDGSAHSVLSALREHMEA